MSTKERKKAMRAKAAEASDDSDADAKKQALKEKLSAKKAAAEPPNADADATTETKSGSSSGDAAETPAAEAATPVREYSTPEITADAAKHKAGLDDPTLPDFQNPLMHNNPLAEKNFRQDYETEEEFSKATNENDKLPPVEDPNDESTIVMVPKHVAELVDECVHLSMLEMNELITRIQEHYGFTGTEFEPEDGEGAEVDDDDNENAAEAAAVEKTAFDIKLVGFDAKAKLKVIKEVRSLAGLGLKEAKETVEAAPTIIQKDVGKEMAEEIKSKLEELGAQVEIV